MSCTINDVIKELQKFSDEMFEANSPLVEADLKAFETKYKILLPTQFVNFLNTYNGFNLMGNQLMGFMGNENSIDAVYAKEHGPMPKHVVPVLHDGSGSYYCLDISENTAERTETCAVIYWESGYRYTADDAPETVNDSFCEFVKEVFIDWTLEDYDYEGNEISPS